MTSYRLSLKKTKSNKHLTEEKVMEKKDKKKEEDPFATIALNKKHKRATIKSAIFDEEIELTQREIEQQEMELEERKQSLKELEEKRQKKEEKVQQLAAVMAYKEKSKPKKQESME